MSHMFKQLAIHHSYQEKVRAELRSLPIEKRADSSPLLDHAIKETMRMKSPIPSGSTRRIVKDLIVKKNEKNGYEKDLLIPKGSNVMCAHALLHYNEEYFEDPFTWKPERWINPSDDTKAAFLPFSLGRRNCIGQNLARATIYKTLSTLIADYDFTIAEEGIEEIFIRYAPEGLRLKVTKVE